MTRSFSPLLTSRSVFTILAAFFVLALTSPVTAAPEDDAEDAAQAMARDLEKEGYIFRAEAWTGEIGKEIGKAVKMQLFKGNEYCIGVAVPRKAGVHISGSVLDFAGQPVGEIQPVLEGWGFLLFFKPKKTGVYVVTIHQTEAGKQKNTAFAIITGYK
ncbi:hypothetical protein EI77_03790 [Prosthecobacter fusiformis]|uniref:Uncharacterized protein n=1 Tax=Prosthecobacter fusiformis TaxID=48464 RepID=A0A4V3FE85_9BACT|nr:hypothetical protein [Prosthecobacter fusiformis]TDU66053.1 hypothetical protein EI77_03790 [Prosthecobacter fusiformis]